MTTIPALVVIALLTFTAAPSVVMALVWCPDKEIMFPDPASCAADCPDGCVNAGQDGAPARPLLSGMICGKDQNGDGMVAPDEFRQCMSGSAYNSTRTEYLCPLDAVTCQGNFSTYQMPGASCNPGDSAVVPIVCVHVDSGEVTTYPSVTPSCNPGDTPATPVMCLHLDGHTCPYGNSYPCLPNTDNGVYQCSNIPCGPVDKTPTDTTSYHNDGQTDQNSGACLGQIYLFNGTVGACRPPGLHTNFFQCCSTDPGSFLMIRKSCGSKQKMTAEARADKRTHYVGSHCVDRWPLIGCVQSEEVHCVFQSKLGRIIQEQGRPQLRTGITSWGSARHPNCRGFTPEEFQSLDFSKMDLSEFYADIQTKTNTAIQREMRSNVQNRVNSPR